MTGFFNLHQPSLRISLLCAWHHVHLYMHLCAWRHLCNMLRLQGQCCYDVQGKVELAAKVASYLGYGHKEVAEAAKEVCKRFKKAHPTHMPQVNASNHRAAWMYMLYCLTRMMRRIILACSMVACKGGNLKLIRVLRQAHNLATSARLTPFPQPVMLFS